MLTGADPGPACSGVTFSMDSISRKAPQSDVRWATHAKGPLVQADDLRVVRKLSNVPNLEQVKTKSPLYPARGGTPETALNVDGDEFRRDERSRIGCRRQNPQFDERARHAIERALIERAVGREHPDDRFIRQPHGFRTQSLDRRADSD